MNDYTARLAELADERTEWGTLHDIHREQPAADMEHCRFHGDWPANTSWECPKCALAAALYFNDRNRERYTPKEWDE